MKTFKTLDFWISILLIIFFFFAAVSSITYISTCYLIIWAWQLFSMIIHELFGWFMQKNGERRGYHISIATIGLVILLGNWFAVFLWAGFLILFASPALFILYAAKCYEECQILKQRPLSVLK